MSTQIKIKGFNYPAATVREDILEQKLSVPVGSDYYGSSAPLAYRWKGDEFQVFLNEKWQTAESIDFDMD